MRTRLLAAHDALFRERRLDAIPEFFAADYVAHVTDGRIAGGHALVRQQLDLLWAAFTDLTLELEFLVEAGDRIAWQRTLRATHTGAFKGFPATGRPLVWRDMVTSRMADDRIAEEWVITDLVERFVRARKPRTA